MEREELELLLADIDAFIGKIFDNVAPLGRVDFLHQVYDFKATVQNKLEA